MKPIWKLVITIYLAAAALSAVSAGARYAWDEGEKARCVRVAHRFAPSPQTDEQDKAGRISVRLPDGSEIDVATDDAQAADRAARIYWKNTLRAEAIRRGLISWKDVPPEQVDEVAYKLAKLRGDLDDPLWCQKEQNLKWWFYSPGLALLGLAGLAILLAVPLALLYAIVRVIKLAWR